MKQRIECPYCDGKATLRKEARELSYRKDVFKIVAHFYKCGKCGEEFTTTEADTISLMQAHNQYREKNNIPFPQEIAAIRLKYDLSASKMSEVLGLGANGYSNYENGEIPTPAYGNLISAASDPQTFMNLFDKAKEHFSDKAFRKVKEKIAHLIQEENEGRNPCANLNVYNEPNNYTGYKQPVAAKIANLVIYFIQNSKAEFNDKLKLNKQLFFADFTHYKNNGSSISGLTYRAITYGPVPSNYDNIFAYLENEMFINSQFLKLPNGGAREVFVSQSDFDKNMFTEAEMETLTTIREKFSDTSTWDIVDLSHQEKAWKKLEANRGLIGYQDYAFELAAV
jgi:putative zinc finger/helix-turn-helix YgiT family protein